MNDYNKFLDEKIKAILSLKGGDFYNENVGYEHRSKDDKIKIEEQFAAIYDLEKMTLLEKHKLFNELSSVDNVETSGNIKTIKFWVKFWSILYLVAIGIGAIVLMPK